MKRVLSRTGYLLIVAAVVASNLVLNRATIVRAEAVRQIPTRIDATSTPADITITSLLNRVVGTGDFNGDGADDFLAEYNKGGGMTPAFQFEKFGIIFGKPNQNQPIKIDLEKDSPDLSLTTEVRGTLGSSQIATLGDLNEDGIDDIALSHRVPREIPNSLPDVTLRVFFGSPQLSAGVLDLDTLHADLTIHVTQEVAYFVGVAGVADVNGDGIKDLLLTLNLNYYFFALPILFGPFTAGETIDFATRSPDVIIRVRDFSGVSIIKDVFLADVNGDRITDVLIRSPWDGRSPSIGADRKVIGDTVGIPARLEVILGSQDLKSRPEIILSHFETDANILLGFEAQVVATGDINADGADDVVVGADDVGFFVVPWFNGMVNVTLGFPSLRGRVSQSDALIFGNPPPNAFQPIPGKVLGNRLGASVAVSDINGDGVGDILIGAPGQIGDESGNVKPLNRAYVILGSTEIETLSRVETGREQQDITISFDSKTSGVGSRVGSGDFNGDGVSDILVGNGSDTYIFFGGPLRAPDIRTAKYKKGASELQVFGTDLTGSARVEVNGVLIDRDVTFEPDQGRIVLQGSRSELNLHGGKNQIAVVRKGARSNTVKVKL